MAFTADIEKFRFDPALAAGVRGKRVLITGASRDGGLGQAFAIAAALNGAECVAVHFHNSYADAFELVAVLRGQGVDAFPLQADVTNMRDLWASRSYVIEQFGGKTPDLLICNSGLTEQAYSFGRALREVEGEPAALRRARVRQHFIDHLEESRVVLDTKIDGFLAMTHLWAGEALYHQTPLQIVYISSRQAIDPGAGVPGYAIANWAVLQLPNVLDVNLAKNAELISAFSVLPPFVRTGMTEEFSQNARVFGRWQPRMLETFEMAEALLQLLAQPPADTRGRMFELMAEADPNQQAALRVTWQALRLEPRQETLAWSEANPLVYRSPEA